MKNLRLKETCTQYTTARNRYGDLVLTNVGSLLCIFRNVRQLGLNASREEITISGIFWFAPSATVKIGDVISIYGQQYRLESVNDARDRLLSNTTQFLKCTASLLRQIS